MIVDKYLLKLGRSKNKIIYEVVQASLLWHEAWDGDEVDDFIECLRNQLNYAHGNLSDQEVEEISGFTQII